MLFILYVMVHISICRVTDKQLPVSVQYLPASALTHHAWFPKTKKAQCEDSQREITNKWVT